MVVDLLKKIETIVATPGSLGTNRLESRAQQDTSGFSFVVTNISIQTKMVNVKLYIYFDFKDKNFTVDGMQSSTVANPLIKDVEDLLPAIPSNPITLALIANVNGIPSPEGPYPLTISAGFETEPLLPDPSPNLSIGGGLQVIFVGSDK